MTRGRIVVVLGILVALAACDERSQTPESGTGQRVAPTEAGRGEMGRCTISTPEAGQPVTAEEARVLATDSVGGELDGVETVADTREVCGDSFEVWVVTGTLPNGDDTTTYVTRDGGRIIHVSISGGG